MEKKRSEIQRHADRAVPERASEILAQGRVAHVAFTEGEQPFIIPFAYHFDAATPDRLYLHGSPASRALHIASSGAPLCIAVSLLDGLIYSRSAMFHSLNYRSAVCFGRGARVTDRETQQRVYAAMIARYFAGRTAGTDYAEATGAQLDATWLVEVTIDESSAKAREGGPRGPFDQETTDAPGTFGVVPL
jgi:uncharacterized protein